VRVGAIVNRFAGGYGLPLVIEGEFALRRWFANFGSPQQDGSRFEAEKNLIEAASDLDDYQGAHIELRRCLDPNDKRWRAGPWVVRALDQLCYEVLAAEKAARDSEASSHHHRRHRRYRQRHRRRSIGAFQRPDQAPADAPPSTIPKPPPNPDHPPSPTVPSADASPSLATQKRRRRRLIGSATPLSPRCAKPGARRFRA
jgi:hypothetical protein